MPKLLTRKHTILVSNVKCVTCVSPWYTWIENMNFTRHFLGG